MKKKPNAIRLQIPEPCGEDFSAMHALPGGRHCEKCEKTIVDFREMTDRELVRLYQQRQGRICGIFRPDQLERNLPLPQPPGTNKNWSAIAAVASALMLGTTAGAQQLVAPQFQTEIVSPAKKQMPDTAPGKLTIAGQVLDEKGEPLPFASVILEGTTRGTETELDGFFSIEITDGIAEQELTISFLGYAPQTVLWTKETAMLEVRMKAGIDLPVVQVVYEKPLIEWDLCGMGVVAMVSGDTNSGTIVNEKGTGLESLNSTSINVFPNPFVSSVFVEIETQKPDAYLFHLYTAGGQLVFAESRELPEGHQTLELDLVQRELPEGIYFLRISDGVGEIKTKRIVKVTP